MLIADCSFASERLANQAGIIAQLIANVKRILRRLAYEEERHPLKSTEYDRVSKFATLGLQSRHRKSKSCTIVGFVEVPRSKRSQQGRALVSILQKG